MNVPLVLCAFVSLSAFAGGSSAAGRSGSSLTPEVPSVVVTNFVVRREAGRTLSAAEWREMERLANLFVKTDRYGVRVLGLDTAAADFLSHLGVPVKFDGADAEGPVAAFGSEVRRLTASERARGVLTDRRGAQLLEGLGTDTGVKTMSADASCFTYRNAKGERFAVFGCELKDVDCGKPADPALRAAAAKALSSLGFERLLRVESDALLFHFVSRNPRSGALGVLLANLSDREAEVKLLAGGLAVAGDMRRATFTTTSDGMRTKLPARGWAAAAVMVPCPTPGIVKEKDRPWLRTDLPTEARVEALLSRMTAHEKVMQLSETPVMRMKFVPEGMRLAEDGAGSTYWCFTDPEMRDAVQRAAVEWSRLGVPMFFVEDIIHGAVTLFPSSLGLACSFEPELFERCQEVAGREARAEGLDLVWAPMCDIARDPRWGRVVETCGEDPYLAALCCAAQVRGFRKNVAACAKHYCGYSAVTGGRDYNDTEITPWTLQNLHLPSFRATVDAGVDVVMSAFNSWDGVPVPCSRYLLTDVLRGQLGFRGFVAADWGGISQIVDWGCAPDNKTAAALSLEAGNDLDICSDVYLQEGDRALAEGLLRRETLDEAVRRVLRMKFARGLFEHPYCDPAVRAAARRDAEGPSRALAKEAAAKSFVLLKNDGVLPLAAKGGKVALVGPLARGRREMAGSWVCRTKTVRETFETALRRALPPEASLVTVQGCGTCLEPPKKTLQDGSVAAAGAEPDAVAPLDIAGAVAAARAADVTVLALGEAQTMTGENASRSTLGLTGHQEALAKAVLDTGKPVVAVICSGRPLALPDIWARAAAVVYAWQPGGEGPAALAETLTGASAPSGRLSMSVPRSVGEVPVFYNRTFSGRPSSSLGYRGDAHEGAAWPFGFGLTYTTFAYSPVSIEAGEAACTITNTGKRAGTETVQLYVTQKTCLEGWRPVRELRGIRRVTLPPGASETVRFKLDAATLGYYGRDGKPRCDAGKYEIRIAKDSASGDPAIHER